MSDFVKTGHIIRDTSWIEKQAGQEDWLWGYATVEQPDRSKDIVRVDGLDWSEYHNPPQTYMKILASHVKTLPDGSPPIIGRVEELRKTVTPDGKKAVLFAMSWADTELAKKYSTLYPKYMDSFSIGARSKEYKQIKDGGLDYVKSTLMEISAVTIPDNAGATILRALQTTLGDQLDHEAVISLAQEQLLDLMNSQQELLGKIEKQLVDSSRMLEAFAERLDSLECSIVAKSAAPTTGDRKGRTDLSPVAKQIQNLQRIVNK